MAASIHGIVEPGVRRLLAHGARRLLHAEQDADCGVFTLDHSAQVAHLRGGDVAGLDGEDDLFRLVAQPFVEVDATVDALVCALLAFSGPSADEAERPPLELIRVVLRQLRRIGE